MEPTPAIVPARALPGLKAAPAPNRQQRRALTSMSRNPAKTLQAAGMVDPARLTGAALNVLLPNLRKFGNVISERHRDALARMVGVFSLLAFGKVEGRYAFDLDTGAGKTQSVVAFGAAVASLGFPVSIAVACSKVEALCSLKRDLIANGVPPEMVGLSHTYQYAEGRRDEARQGKLPGFASEPATADPSSRPILLVTHNRIRGGAHDLEEALTYRGRPRDLTIWDESLLISDHRAVEKLALDREFMGLGPLVDLRGTDEMRRLYEFLGECVSRINAELRRQRDGASDPKPLDMPRLSEAEIHVFKGLLEVAGKGFSTDTLSELVEVSQAPMRVVPLTNGGAAVKFDVAVPSSLRRVAVLDASYGIRELERIDRTITKDPAFDGRVKSYDNVTLFNMPHASGRGAMTESFRQERADNRKVSQEIVEVVKTIPKEEALLIFTFKPRGREGQRVDFEGTLRKDLEAQRVDTSATVPVEVTQSDGTKVVEQRPRVVFLTWGSETSLSDYAHCTNVVFAGVLHRSDTDLAGAIVGQRGDLLTDKVAPLDIARVKRSEVAHAVYQAMSRGSCRIIENGQARPMKTWLMMKDEKVIELLKEAMPGLKVARWNAVVLPVYEGKIEKLAASIKATLSTLPLHVTRLTTSKLKKVVLGEKEVPRMTWTKGLRLAIEDDEVDWRISGKSVERTAAVLFSESYSRKVTQEFAASV